MSEAKKILIVEDELPILKILHDRFIQEGFTVYEAKDGQEGLELALSVHPDLILLDIILPVMNGLTMLQKVHADPWGKDARVIMLTNLSDAKSVVGALSQGSHDFLVKSDWKIDDVVKVAHNRLKLQ